MQGICSSNLVGISAAVEQVCWVTLKDLAFDEWFAVVASDVDVLVGLSGNYLRQPIFELIVHWNSLVGSPVS